MTATATANSAAYYIGIDVGTGSARAALVAHDGTLAASETVETRTWRDPQDHRIFEQSTADIWHAIARAVRGVLSDAHVSPEAVKGVGFDATCSLAVTDMHGSPVVVTKGADLGQTGERNVVLWADHRAEEEADLINGTGSNVLDYVGGVMSVCLSFSLLSFFHPNAGAAIHIYIPTPPHFLPSPACARHVNQVKDHILTCICPCLRDMPHSSRWRYRRRCGSNGG